jgi:non-lysosomal glucosylceramidase
VAGTRSRHDGARRNPWNEFECGHHYARAMASWSVLLALSGYQYSAPERRLTFAPRLNAADFRCFFSAGTGWGTFRQTLDQKSWRISLSVREGTVDLRTLSLTLAAGAEVRQFQATSGGQPLPATLTRDGSATVIDLGEAFSLSADRELTIAGSMGSS